MRMKIKYRNVIANIVVLLVSLLLFSCGDIRELESEQMNGSQLSVKEIVEQKLELTSLIINSTEVIVKESPHVSEYTVYVKYEVDKAELLASFTKDAKMIINGMESSGKETLELKRGANQFQIQVKKGAEMRGSHLVMVRKSS